MTVRTEIIIAKCIAFPVYFITMPISFIVGGIRAIKETWKMFIEFDKEELRNKGVNMTEEQIRPIAENYMGVSRMTEEEKEKCQFCLNCDIDGTCVAKQEAPFGSFVCEHNEMFEPCEE